MAQKPQIIDITKSYLPGDPNSFVQNLVNTDREDGEEKTLPILAYEGYNFLPTSYGYKSYFGTNSKLKVNTLPSRVQHILLWQLPSFKSRLIALCEDGIWVATADDYYPSWIHLITHTYNSNVFEEWTWCIIENILYMYKQGKSVVYKTDVGTLEFPNTPDIPAGAGALIGPPTNYQTFTFVQGATGNETDIWNGNFYRITVQYKNAGGQFSQEGIIADWFPVTLNNRSFDISITGSPPLSGLYARIYIEDDDLGLIFYKDFLLTSFPISIPDYTGFVSGVVGSATLTDNSGTPAVNGFYNFYPPSKMLGGPSSILGNNASYHNLWESWEYDYNTSDLTITAFTPSFLNMAGQMGIFRAGTRLGFWDSSNSVSWSSNVDLSDFTPSLENLAGNTIFGYVVGRIVTIKSHGEGYIVYSTKSVVGITFSIQGNLLWDAKKILDNCGISSSRNVTSGMTDYEHFAYTNGGIYTIGRYNALSGTYDQKEALTDLYDYLKESRDPIALKVLQNRYICFSLFNSDYIYSKKSFYTGEVNFLTTVIDWYTYSEATPSGGTAILPEQMWEIIRNEMSGKSSTKRKDGEWVPRYTTTVDIMDDRCYSFWRSWIGEQSTRVPYDSYSTYFNTTPVNLTSGDINTYLNPQRPVSPPDAYRYGVLKTVTGIRAFPWLMEADVKNNNETLIYGQEQEWAGYIERTKANKARLISYSRTDSNVENANTTYTAGNGWTVISTDPVLGVGYATEVTKVIGNLITGEGNNLWLTTDGPSDKSAKEVILRRTFNKALQITKRVRIVYSASPVYKAILPIYIQDPVPGTPNDAYFARYGTEIDVNVNSTNISAIAANVNQLVAYSPTSQTAAVQALLALIPSVQVSSSVHTYMNAQGYSSAFTYETMSYSNPILHSSGIKITYAGRTITFYKYQTQEIVLTQYETAANENVYAITPALSTLTIATVTTTYETSDITGSYGYSQFRALVTHWDRVKFGLYGNYEILETVPAGAMTPKIWDSVYGTDKGTDRDRIWSYSSYSAKSITDLNAGSMGSYDVLPPDPSAPVNSDISGYLSSGTLPVSSFTLPGSTFIFQTGSIETVYPTFKGAFIYDLQLKKWGKYKGDHKVLVELLPVNTDLNKAINYTELGVTSGILDTSGYIYLFDSIPSDSWIRYGKIGFQRLGITWSGEVRVSMRYPSDFRIQVDSSLGGKVLDMNLSQWGGFYQEVEAVFLTDISARWHTIKISGNYDLTGLELRGTLSGRR